MDTVGNSLQLLGTIVTLYGLARTLWTVTGTWERLRSLFTRTSGTTIDAPTATMKVTAYPGMVSTTIPIDDEPTVEDALRRLARGIQEVEVTAWKQASELDARMEALRSDLDRHRGLVGEQINDALTAIDAKNRQHVLRDLWIAVFGVALTLVGQAFALFG